MITKSHFLKPSRSADKNMTVDIHVQEMQHFNQSMQSVTQAEVNFATHFLRFLISLHHLTISPYCSSLTKVTVIN